MTWDVICLKTADLLLEGMPRLVAESFAADHGGTAIPSGGCVNVCLVVEEERLYLGDRRSVNRVRPMSPERARAVIRSVRNGPVELRMVLVQNQVYAVDRLASAYVCRGHSPN